MEIVLAAFIASLVTWLMVRSNYHGQLQDMRDVVAYERKRRLQEEDRAEVLSDALFGRTKTRHSTGIQN